jgi:glucose-1-phosphate cytidylyltransferase
MVEIGGLPLLWHIMKGYGEHGLNELVCCLGYRGDMIKRWFLDYRAMGSDMTVDTARAPSAAAAATSRTGG